MISEITLCMNHGRRTKDVHDLHPSYTFSPGYNALVGPNGFGKTTILSALASCDACQKDSHEPVFYMSTESLNPLMSSGHYKNRVENIMAIRAMFSSHGEIVRDVMSTFGYRGENIFLFDTPETGQDFEQCRLIHSNLQSLVSKGFQVIVSTHEPIFLQNANIIELKKGYYNHLVSSRMQYLKDLQ
ncbi:MAG: hypothetical protein ACMXYK_02710 [Candidatus Woesearchaeota archaeon]